MSRRAGGARQAMRVRVLGGLLALGAMLGVLVLRAPAAWLDVALAHWTQDRVRLTDVSGTVWAGRGRLVLADVARGSEAERGRVVPGMAIPGVFAWRVSPGWLCLGRLQARIEHDSMEGPVAVTGTRAGVQITPGRLVLPALALDRMGSPWNTIRPFGSLKLAWESMHLQQGQWEGRAQITLTEVASALTPVRPLGAYLIDVTAQGQGATLQMRTLAGPLRLSGDGLWQSQRGLQFVAWAQVDEPERARLLALLSLLGRRQGDRTMIKIGA